MMRKTAWIIPSIPIIIAAILQFPYSSLAEPRAKTVEFICGKQMEHNTTIYVPNFVATMENISAQVRSAGFGVAKTGTGPDTNYGLAQCYGDLSSVDCVLCYAEARTVLPQCYPVNGGRIYLDGCFMRAENYSFFHEFTGPDDHARCGNSTRKDSAFQASARQALSQVVSAASVNNGYGRAQVPVAGRTNESAYVLADCWRTISPSSCRACLENASASISKCLPWSEGRALNTGCFMRYSDTNFLNPVPRNRSFKGRVVAIVIASVSAAAVLIIGAVIGFYVWKNRKIQKKRKGDAVKLVKTLNDSSLNFKYSTLENATASFDEANKLGQGGFGTVYKGVLPDGREIAVKRLFFNNKHRAADFYNEVNIISSVEHKNLVRLLGCSCSGPESLLVYEFLPNQSLDRFIFDSSKGKALNWEKRFEIIIGTAEGLVYLHENTKTRIIHRDIKASNILLDSRLRAKIADFGLARSFQEDKSHISTAIAGTLGYMAPEYLAHGQLTEKADVYSFGVLLLEIVTGRQNNRSKATEYTDSLVTIAWKHFQQRRVEELFDPNLMLNNYHSINVKGEVLRVVHVGLLCTQEIPSLRPSMSKALLMLVKKEHLPAPTSPPFMDEATMEFNDMSENMSSTPLHNGNAVSVASISHSIFYPR
ncbi:cysteine-rich receptor-like protein kinase 2 [Andrographis paniculata]|uniref:cysteine-rich receptor-like protein kinase 2 n=1 Tax=Andrographis paniculata TaxID=175694 RepID=UPI0021E844A2|nr:cysteine-rich receptor-like protein kinase 2 [Andrographis paniculata]